MMIVIMVVIASMVGGFLGYVFFEAMRALISSILTRRKEKRLNR